MLSCAGTNNQQQFPGIKRVQHFAFRKAGQFPILLSICYEEINYLRFHYER